MKIIKDIAKMKTYSKVMKKEAKLIGFIPTMGYLHEGHLSLISAARKQTDIVIVSIFVNPIQFGPKEDFKKYPRDIEKDEELARSAGADIIFYPTLEGMYPKEYSTYVNVERLTDGMCGKSREGHFRGVTTVVMKLFQITKPDIAYFGQKDAQQAAVIGKMVDDLNMDVMIKVMPIVREKDGLAMSSRNTYLMATERKEALSLRKALKLAEEMVGSGEKDTKKIIGEMRKLFLKAPSAKIDYIAIVDAKSLKNIRTVKGRVLVALAVFIGKTRLIDNAILSAERITEENNSHARLCGSGQKI
ncbi:pantoate--beta-alanine ligase [Candidatus Omnitrophota bacterium]